MTPPTLTLPPPAETLWQAIGETVREQLRSMSDGQAQYHVLRGKLERAEEPLARDVFDLIEANEKEPEALEAAVNAISREAAESIAQNHHWAAPTIAADAEKALRGIPEHETNRDSLATGRRTRSATPCARPGALRSTTGRIRAEHDQHSGTAGRGTTQPG